MSVGENHNGLRGKAKAAGDLCRRKESKCPLLGCDGCDGEEEAPPGSTGSVAERAQAWERSTSGPGYVTIGSVRYGVRFSSATSADAMPSTGDEHDHHPADFCCDVMQMAWPRPRGSSLPPSKIPLPSNEKAINKRPKAPEETATPVFRSTLQVSRPKKSPVGCFAVDSHESNSGDMKPTPPTPSPARRPLFPKPNFKFGAPSGDPDTSKLISDPKDDVCPTPNQFHITLDKLHRFRFGGDKTGPGGKKKRAGDKTERLRELTDKLLHSRGTHPAGPDGKKPPPTKIPNKTATGPSLRNLFGSNASLTNSKPTASAPDRNSAPEEPCEDGPVRKAEPRPLLGSYTQRMTAFRSASFSQGDYDGAKHPRTNRKEDSVTFPRVKQVDASTSVSPPPDKVTEKTGSTPSVDSAVGSDEGFVMGSSNNLAVVSETHKPSGSRSLTYPFTKKLSKSDEMPFSSIDGNGLKSLQHSPSPTRELSDVKEEVSGSSETPADTLSECSNETLKETCDSVANGGDAGEKTVYQCTVSMQFPNTLAIPQETPTDPLDTLEREMNEFVTQKGNTSPKPEIYVTTWPKEIKDGETQTKPKLTVKCENPDWRDADDGKESLRWSGETTNSEPISPEDATVKWPKTDKPTLTCQSSDERDEDVAPPCCRRYQLLSRNDSMSEGDSDHDRRPSTPLRDRERTSSPSPYSPVDLSDSEGRTGRSCHGPRRYSKRPLRGPYGQMLEAEMKKPETTRLLSKKQLNDDLKFLQDYIAPLPEDRSGPADTSRPSSDTNRLSSDTNRPSSDTNRPSSDTNRLSSDTNRLSSDTNRLSSDTNRLSSDTSRPSSDTDRLSSETSRLSSECNRPSSESRLTCPRQRFNPGRSLDDSQLQNVYGESGSSPGKRKGSGGLLSGSGSPQKDGVVVCHQRTTSSPSQLEGISGGGVSGGSGEGKGSARATQELLAELLKGSSERRFVTEDNPLGSVHNTKVRVVCIFIF